jgi:riboflavin kinase/FMN adenylyltransferase
MTVGGFDGIHLGHRALLDRVLAFKGQFEATVITFAKSPKAVLKPDSYPGDICTTAQKLDILKALGIAHTVLIDFSRNFSTLSGREFIEFLISRGGLRRLVVGSNFRCGHRMDTGTGEITALCAAAGIVTEVLAPVLAGSKPVSSSRIRTALASGDFAQAEKLLGRAYELDLAGFPCSREDGLARYELGAGGSIALPSGSYPVRTRGEDSGEKGRAEARICNGYLLLASPLKVRRIEFGPL